MSVPESSGSAYWEKKAFDHFTDAGNLLESAESMKEHPGRLPEAAMDAQLAGVHASLAIAAAMQYQTFMMSEG